MPAKRSKSQPDGELSLSKGGFSSTSSSSSSSPSSFVQNAVSGLAAPENRSLVTAVGLFAAGVAFLHSSWSELLLPPA